MTPYEKLNAPFRERYGHDFGAERGDFKMAETDSSLTPLLESYNRSGLERGKPSSLAAQSIDETRAREEQQADLPDFSERFLAGETKLGPELLKRWQDVQDRMSGALSQEYGAREGRTDTEGARAVEAWASIRATDPKYADPETGVPDYDTYRADKDAAFAKLPTALRRAYEISVNAIDPTLRQVEPQIKKAFDLRSQLFETISPYAGLSVQSAKGVKDFQASVAEARTRLARAGIDTAKIDSQELYQVVAKQQGKPSGVATVAWMLRPGSTSAQKFQNLDWYRFLLDHQEELAPFFPDLYKRRELQKALKPNIFQMVASQ